MTAVSGIGWAAALAGKPRGSNPETDPARRAEWFEGYDRLGPPTYTASLDSLIFGAKRHDARTPL